MKRSWIALLLLAVAFPAIANAQPQPKKKPKPPCRLKLADCPDEGCDDKFDPNLNRRKNIRSDDQAPTLRSLTWMKKLDDPEDFTEGDTREELAALGEGQKITVMAHLLVVRDETGGDGESCNCHFHTLEATDNHLVLVSKTTVNKFPITNPNDTQANKQILRLRERESLTAEFTPRVRLDHPNFLRAKVQPLIDHAPQKALQVRVTGLLLFDSEHLINNPLVRVNNWEIHPVLKLEFCPAGAKCKATSDAGWQSLDDVH